MEIVRVEPHPTRPCLYYLGLQGGSVYADFDKDEFGCLYLVRISYDGYGCHHVSKDVARLSKINSSALIDHIEAGDLAAPAVAKIIRDYFYEIRGDIWEDALKDHSLI
jgi:hypothetical protein